MHLRITEILISCRAMRHLVFLAIESPHANVRQLALDSIIDGRAYPTKILVRSLIDLLKRSEKVQEKIRVMLALRKLGSFAVESITALSKIASDSTVPQLTIAAKVALRWIQDVPDPGDVPTDFDTTCYA